MLKLLGFCKKRSWELVRVDKKTPNINYYSLQGQLLGIKISRRGKLTLVCFSPKPGKNFTPMLQWKFIIFKSCVETWCAFKTCREILNKAAHFPFIFLGLKASEVFNTASQVSSCSMGSWEWFLFRTDCSGCFSVVYSCFLGNVTLEFYSMESIFDVSVTQGKKSPTNRDFLLNTWWNNTGACVCVVG